jgi:hypothetical protein
MPANTLLCYNYGAAAVKQWGKNTAVLDNRAGLPCPPIPEVLPVGRWRSYDNR